MHRLRPAARRTLPAFVLLTVACPVVGRADEPAATAGATGEIIAVRVGDTPIYRAELDAALRRAARGADPDPGRQARLVAETVEQMVDERLLRREIEARNVEVDEDEVTAVITRMRGQLAERKTTLEKFLAESGRDEAALRSQIRLEAALRTHLAPQLTETVLEATYAKHRRDLDGTLVRASHIVLRPDAGRGAEAVLHMERQAAAIRAEILRGGVGFAEAARRHSAGPSRRQGGDIGYFPRRGLLDEEFCRRVFALAKGEISQPFATAFGMHIVLLTDVQPGTMTLEALRPQLETLWVQEAIREIVDRGRRDMPIEYAPDVPHFDPDVPRDTPGRRVVTTSAAATAP